MLSASKTTALSRKQFASLDLLKFLFIFLILLAHTGNEWAHATGLFHYILSLYNFGVPFCFACSGYLFYSKLLKLEKEEQWGYYKKYSYRLGKMYLAWSVVYIIFTIVSWYFNDVEIEKIYKSIQTWIVYSTYSTIWFLPALWGGITISYILLNKTTKYQFLAIVSVLFVFGNLMASYSNVMCGISSLEIFDSWYNSTFITYRNAIFNGTPFVSLGLLICNSKNRKSAGCNLLFACFFALMTLVEAIIIKKFNLSSMTDMTFFMLPTIYFLMEWALKINIKYNNAFKWMRNLSMLVFCGQRIFLSAIPSVCPAYKEWLCNMIQVSQVQLASFNL